MLDNKKLGKKIARIRIINNYTQDELAEKMNFGDRVKVSRIENGKQCMTANELLDFCDFFKVSIDNLLNEYEINIQDFIEFGNRFIRNRDITADEKREVIKNLYIKVSEDELNDIFMYRKMNNTQKIDKNSLKINIEKMKINDKIIEKGGI